MNLRWMAVWAVSVWGLAMSPVFAVEPSGAIEIDQAAMVEYQRYVKARQLVAQHYVDPKKMDDTVLLFSSLRGMIWSVDPLGDVWSAEDYGKFQTLKKPLTEEMGLRWTIRNRGIVVLNVIPKSPAERANVKVGDFLVKVDGKDLGQGTSLADLDRVCFGAGRTAVLEFLHTRTEISLPVTLKAERIIDEMQASKIGEFGVLTVGSAKGARGEDGRQRLKSLRPEQLQGLVVDLRRTSDLDLAAAAGMAGLLMTPEHATWGFESAAGTLTALSLTRGEETYTDVPVVVIVDRGTSGPAEVLAAALGDSHRAVVIGQPTAGCVPSQIDQTLPNGMVCRLTKGFFAGLNKEDINEKGIEPMIKVELPARQPGEAGAVKTEKPDEKDVYMEKAKMLLNAVVKARAMSSAAPVPSGAKKSGGR